MVPTDEPTVPPEVTNEECDGHSDLAATLEGESDEDFLGTDKQATPQVRSWSAQALEKELSRAPPQVLAPQRDSDAKQEVRASMV